MWISALVDPNALAVAGIALGFAVSLYFAGPITISACAFAFGAYFAACEVYGTYEFLIKDQGDWTYIVYAGCGIAAAVSFLPAWASHAWRGRRDLSLALWVLFCLCMVSVVVAGISRTGAAADTAQESREGISRQAAAAERSERDARAALKDANEALGRAQASVTDNAAKRDCVQHCKDLLIGAVRSAEAEVAAAQRTLADATAAVAAAPPRRGDALSRRIAAMSPFTEEQVRLYQPVIVPSLASGLSAVLMAFGIWSLGSWRTARLAVTPTASGIAHAASGAMQPPLAVAEAPPATLVAEVPEVTQTTRPLALTFSGPGSALIGFAGQCIARSDGSDVAMRDVRRAYEDFCAREITSPLGLPEFTRELARFCQECEIPIRVEGRDVYIVGARLV